LVAAMRRMPFAASGTLRPSGSAARDCIARFGGGHIGVAFAAGEKRSAPKRPSSKFASVMVGSVPPRP